jgi:hypothetical protein
LSAFTSLDHAALDCVIECDVSDIVAGTAFSDVTSLDSSHGLVDNSPYVNGIVKVALSALKYIYGLENQTTANFDAFANNIKILVENDMHPAYGGYKKGQNVVSAFVNLLCFMNIFKCLNCPKEKNTILYSCNG